MSNFTGYGTLTTDTAAADVTVCGWATLIGTLASGAGTLTWQVLGLDGVWIPVIGGTDNITVQAYTASHMANAFFGTGVRVRCVGSAGTAPDWDWQVVRNPRNRGT